MLQCMLSQHLKYKRSSLGMGTSEGVPRKGRRVMGRMASITSSCGTTRLAADLASGPSTGLASIWQQHANLLNFVYATS